MNGLILLAGMCSPPITPEEWHDLQNIQRFQVDPSQVEHCWRFAKEVREQAEIQALYYPHIQADPRHQDFIEQCIWHEQVWDKVDNIFRLYHGWPSDQLRNMRRLKALIGEDAYHAGKLPPIAPFHLFREMR